MPLISGRGPPAQDIGLSLSNEELAVIHNSPNAGVGTSDYCGRK